MPQEAGKTSTNCDACDSRLRCTPRSTPDRATMTGFRLVVCAFMVFVGPLLAAVCVAGLVHYCTGSLRWSTLAAVTAAVCAIGAARPVTERVVGTLSPTDHNQSHRELISNSNTNIPSQRDHAR